ncbi:MAG: hypothetical protein HYY18_04155 [Planctomycetes bacterium]|nr:hypothetical protein [Planctomycetota bacterium]
MKILPILSLFVAGLACFAEDEVLFGKSDHAWAGIETGTWAKYERTTQSGGRTTVESWKETLLRIEETQLVFRFDTTRNGKTESKEEPSPFVAPWTVQWSEIGKETLEVGGQKVECRILERAHRDGSGTTKSWRGKVDGREIELRSELESKVGGGTFRQTVKITHLSEEVAIGDVRVACRVEELSSETVRGDKSWSTTSKTWSSEKLPGRIARSERTDVDDGEKTVTTTRLESYGAPESD